MWPVDAMAPADDVIRFFVMSPVMIKLLAFRLFVAPASDLSLSGRPGCYSSDLNKILLGGGTRNAQEYNR